MYRKVASEILKNKIDYNNLIRIKLSDSKVSSFENLQNEELRTEKIAQMASKIAIFPALRNMLDLKQKEFINKSNEQFGGCVLDGRDIGTKILPHTNFKFFIDASIEIRAKRRLLEKNISFLHENDEKCMLQSLIENMVERDNIDRSRKDSPMVPAKDAYVIDTTSMNADQLLSISNQINRRKLNI